MKIIIVDDDVFMGEMLSSIVRHLGANVKFFDNPSVALKAFLRSPNSFDGAILDIVMPGMIDGIDLGERMRAARPDFNILFCSSFDQSQSPDVDARMCNLGEKVDKPFDNKEAMASIAEAFGL